MKIEGFRITNFRSIVDTGWRNFSPDNVTVLVGQNESGKTSVLEALANTFSTKNISADDTRIQEPLPKVYLRVKIEDSDQLLEELKGFYPSQTNAFETYLKGKKSILELIFLWEVSTQAGKVGQYEGTLQIVDDGELEKVLTAAISKPVLAPSHPQSASVAIAEALKIAPASTAPDVPSFHELTLGDIADAIDSIAPSISLFDHSTGLLPSQIDIDESKFALVGPGAAAASNFLTAAGLDLKKLVISDPRTRESLLLKANDAVTKDFATFWSQTIGKASKLKLECAVQTYGAEVPDKVGKKYLLFWVSDGLNKLYPKQRSQGVRWFVSFYLQLKASEKKSLKRVFLLDEPGANLHAKAQADVIKLINKLSGEIPIVYSTHSSHMLEYDKLYRVLAVQRVGEEDESPTEIKPAHELGTASTDTLSPVLTAMGVNLSSQEVIRKNYNVLLEEMSGFYYLTAFWELLAEKHEAHFIAATGVNKVENLANMFRGWGLQYIVVIDDDSNGRKVYNGLKKDLYGEDEDLAKANMYKIKDCQGIEDIFSQRDFKKWVLGDEALTISGSNSEYLKTSNHSKPVLGYTFLLKVREKGISTKELEKDTLDKIKSVVAEITRRLKGNAKIPAAA